MITINAKCDHCGLTGTYSALNDYLANYKEEPIPGTTWQACNNCDVLLRGVQIGAVDTATQTFFTP